MSSLFFELGIIYLFASLTSFLNIFLPPTPGLFQSLLLNFFDAKIVVSISLMCAFWNALARVIIFKKEIIRKDLVKITILGIFGSIVGGYLIGVFSNEVITIIIFGFILKAFLDFVFTKRDVTVQEIHHTKFDLFVSGFVANFITAVGGVSGIRKNFYLAKGYTMQQALGTISVLQLFAMSSALVPRFYFQEIEVTFVLKLFPVFLLSIVVSILGRKILIKMTDSTQRKVVFWLLLFSVLLILPQTFGATLKLLGISF